MTEPDHDEQDEHGPYDEQDTERIGERAHLLPEELAAGSDDPEAQAEQILADSEERTQHPYETRAESSQTLGEGA